MWDREGVTDTVAGRVGSNGFERPLAELRGCRVNTVNNKSFDSKEQSDGVWGELVVVDNLTGHDRAFTVFIRIGSFLIVNHKGEEPLSRARTTA